MLKIQCSFLLFSFSAGHVASVRESSFVFVRIYMHQGINYLQFSIIYLIFIQCIIFQQIICFPFEQHFGQVFPLFFPFSLVYSRSNIKYTFISILFNNIFHSPGLLLTYLTLLVLHDFGEKKNDTLSIKKYVFLINLEE